MSENYIAGILNLHESPDLGGLTATRTLGSTSFLGRFAVMDFALSNFTNSNINEISILIKNNFRSVAKHVSSLKSYVNNTKRGRQRLLINEKGMFKSNQNTDLANLKTNDWILYEARANYVVILPAHILYHQNLRELVNEHVKSNAKISILYQDIDNADKTFLTSDHLVVDENNRVTKITLNDKKDVKASVSLETYVMSVDVLFDLINKYANGNNPKSLKQVLRSINLKNNYINAVKHNGYARSLDSFKAFVDTSFELLDAEPADELFVKEWPTYTTSHDTPPAYYDVSSSVSNAFIANGAIIKGSVKDSIISRRVRVEKGAIIKNSIILTGTCVGEGARIENAVVDKYVHIAPKTVIKGTKKEPIYVEQGKELK